MSEPSLPASGSDDAMAAELALGLLSGPERAEASRRRLADAAFARAVEGWEASLAALADATTPVTPPDALWRRISEELGGPRAQDEALVLRLRRRVAVWRTASLAAAGLAACLAIALVRPHASMAPGQAPVLAARLTPSVRSPAVFVVLYDPARRSLVLTPAQVQPTGGRSPELWLIPSGGRPVPLGVGDFANPVQIASSQSVQGLTAGALAVSIEPKGGSATGQPTGPVVATGQLSRL